ncbi:hypothetical protein JX266_001438 [Neoarthrinium moseri]|nr:hypothetical protein JX266_001438 [Neoarthrinium moseri]
MRVQTLGLAAVLSSTIPLASGQCSRDALQAAADHYVATRSTGLMNLRPLLIENASYIENNNATALTGGVLSQTMIPAHNRSTIDTTACATYTELIVVDEAKPYVIGTQIRYKATNTSSSPDGPRYGGLRATLIDSVVSTTGSWMFNASQTLSHVMEENWGPIANSSKRDTRATLQQAADRYLDLWGPNATAAAEKVPWGTPCRRLEGSMYTGQGRPDDRCDVGLPEGSSPPNTNRRYVIDEEAGSVNVLCTFQTMQDAPDSHEFRVEGGRLRYVHTMTVCACVFGGK